MSAQRWVLVQVDLALPVRYERCQRPGAVTVDWGCRRTRRRAEPEDTARPTEGQHNRQEPGGRLDSRASPCRGKAPAQGGPRVMVGARGGVGVAGNNRPSGPPAALTASGPGGAADARISRGRALRPGPGPGPGTGPGRQCNRQPPPPPYCGAPAGFPKRAPGPVRPPSPSSLSGGRGPRVRSWTSQVPR